MKQEGYSPTGYIKIKTRVCTVPSRDKERNKENEKDYTRASSHNDIRDFLMGFSLRITKANSFLKCCKHEPWEG